MTGTAIITTSRRHVINSRVAIPAGTTATIVRSLGRDTFIGETTVGQLFIAGPNHFQAA